MHEQGGAGDKADMQPQMASFCYYTGFQGESLTQRSKWFDELSILTAK